MLTSLRFRALAVPPLAVPCALFPVRALTQTTSSFSQHTLYNSNETLQVMAHGDFNNDGREDLIVTETQLGASSGSTDLLLSNGDGTYDAPIKLATPPGQQIAVGDFTNDGKLDYAALDIAAHVVHIWVGHGDGTFTNGTDLEVGNNPLAIATADMNHDNITDVIVASGTPGNTNLTIWMESGNSTGSGQTATNVTSGLINPTFIAAGDFDGDGKPDVALVSQGTGATTVQVLYGDGAGHVANPTQLTDPNGYTDYGSPFGVGDIDNNGTSDLAMVQWQGGTSGTAQAQPRIAVFKGNTNRTLSFSTINTQNGCPYGNVQIADFNGDGLNDLFYTEGPCTGGGTYNGVVNPATGKGVFGGSEQVVYTFTIGVNLFTVKSTQGTKPDIAFAEDQQPSTSSTAPTKLGLLENTTSGGSFPGCGTTNQATGINVCTPSGASANSPVNFSISAAGPTAMRTVAVWADGQKVSEQLTHAFSNYSFLDQAVTLSAGTHNITVYGTGWDDTLQQKSFTLDVGSGTGCGAPSSPGVNVCKPASGATVGSPTEVQATASITGTLARMEVWVDGTKMFTETTSTSLDTKLNLASGYHRFDIYAVNTAGTKYETTVYATVGSGNGCAAPSGYGVNVCSPANGTTVNSPVQVTATANIVGTLARMEIWVNAGKVYTETTSTNLSTTLNLGAGSDRFDIYAVNTQGTKYETTVYATVK